MTSKNPSVLFTLLLEHRWRITIASVVGICAALIYVTIADRMYTVQLVASPARHVSEVTGGAGMALGAALGTLGIPGMQQDANAQEYLAILRSRTMTDLFIEKNNLMPILFEDDWHAESGVWRDSDDAPSNWDGNQLFSESVLSISEDLRQGLIYVRVTWNNPEIAATWANSLIELANQQIRERAIEEATKNINYLEGELEEVAVYEVRQAIGSLILTHIQNVMLAKTQPDYAFKVIDPAQSKDRDNYDYPKPAILIFAGALFAAAFYMIILLVGVVFSGGSDQSINADSVDA